MLLLHINETNNSKGEGHESIFIHSSRISMLGWIWDFYIFNERGARDRRFNPVSNFRGLPIRRRHYRGNKPSSRRDTHRTLFKKAGYRLGVNCA